MPARIPRLAAVEADTARIAALSEHLDDETVLTGELQVLRAIEFDGLDPQTVTDEVLAGRYQTLAEAVRGLDGPGLVVRLLTVKWRVPPDAGAVARVGEFSLSDRRHAAMVAEGCFRLRIVLLLELNARRPGSGVADLFRKPTAGSLAADVDAARVALDQAAARLVSALAAWGPRSLGLRRVGGQTVSELATFLNFLLEARWREIAIGQAPLARRMGKARLSYPQLDHIEFRLPAERVHGAMLGLSDYPDMLAADVTLPLVWARAEYACCVAWRPVSREFALEQVRLQRRKLVAARDDSRSQMAEIARMLDAAAAGRVLLGRCWFGILVLGRGATPAERSAGLNRSVEAVESALSEQGFSVVREDLAMASAHWAMLPGSWRLAPRVVTVTNRNFAALAGLHATAPGPEGNPWGRPLGYLATPSGVPYRFSLHVGDLGNALVVGPSGSGKSVLLAWMFLHARALGANVVVLDKDRSAHLAVSGFGGRYVGFRHGRPTGISPLAGPAGASSLRQFLQILLRRPESDGAAASELDAAVRAAMAVPAARRRLRHVADALDPAGALHRDLRRWVRDGDRAWVFDSDAELAAGDTGLAGFDVGVFLDDPELRAPVLHALFERLQPRLDGTPTLVVIDEFWRVAGDPVFAGYVRDWLATLRKRNGAVLLATQSLSDVTGAGIARTVVEQAPTRMFFGNRAGRDAEHVEGAGLSPEESRLVRVLPARTFLLCQGGQSCVCRLDLAAVGEVLRLLAGRAEDLAAFDRALARGDGEREAALAATARREKDGGNTHPVGPLAAMAAGGDFGCTGRGVPGGGEPAGAGRRRAGA